MQTAIAKRLPTKLFACDFPPVPPPEPAPEPQPDVDCQSYHDEVRLRIAVFHLDLRGTWV